MEIGITKEVVAAYLDEVQLSEFRKEVVVEEIGRQITDTNTEERLQQFLKDLTVPDPEVRISSFGLTPQRSGDERWSLVWAADERRAGKTIYKKLGWAITYELYLALCKKDKRYSKMIDQSGENSKLLLSAIVGYTFGGSDVPVKVITAMAAGTLYLVSKVGIGAFCRIAGDFYTNSSKSVPMSLGFIGTPDGMTDHQKDSLRKLIRKHKGTEFHHCDGIGADAEAHVIHREFQGSRIVVHVSENKETRALCDGDEIRESKDRYRYSWQNMVDACDLLIAAPNTKEKKGNSMSWTTVSYARQRGVPVIILEP
ncbi:MAG: hypothetical protein ACLGJB_17690 [Blastocatellia bacterium]